MQKRYVLRLILLAGIILGIPVLTVFCFLPSNYTSRIVTFMNQALALTEPLLSSSSPVESNNSSSPPQTMHSLPTPILKPTYISDAQALVLYEKGLKLYYQRQFPEALDLFNQALQIDALCYEALNAKGATLAFQGHYDQGLALIQQALNLNSSYVYANFNQGLAYELAGRWDESIAAYQRALQIDNQDTWSYYGIASIYGRQGNVDKVLEYLKLAIALDAGVKEVARNEHDFAPVRNDLRFQTLVKP